MMFAKKLDSFTVDIIEGEPAIVTMANKITRTDFNYSGCAILGKDFILDLCRHALDNQIIDDDDLQSLSHS